MRRASGFTLLEVVVALAILGLALMAIFDLNAGAVSNHVYTKRLTVASLLARAKMTDVEQKLYDDGFSPDDDEESGDFSDEGWSQFKWKARIIAPKLDGVSPDQLIGALFNLPIGGGDSDDPMSGIASLFGGGAGGGKDGASSGPQPAGGGLGGAAMGMAQPMFTQMVQQLTQTVREVHLTVYWQEGTQLESIDLVTHVVSLGPGSDRNGGFTATQGTTPGADNQWVDPDSPGMIVQNPIPGPNGTMLHPETRKPLMRRSEWLQRANGGSQPQRGGGNGGVVPNPGGGIFGGGRPSIPNFPGMQQRNDR
ncbi:MULTISPECIES: prepilin-type N-terminal cleavage/methylation domain-containing protein [Myxococcus]|uniref:Prepilin-type N-terminal cleavage/methylation domain-containing protein n=1 Tax=Myxococcus llanfairpwllgwyngyllgogerychwyrndrobwllllantysiliogogogochensis TaxID=2590453 RepID=A0A540WZT3_9BACT|nr:MULTISPECIES: prepilin-type N-terminal cleavage/methylation domain-containing protein [Myxococcus]NTX04229.1 prepilin-type N-terminal cleavage/methylation domain-containing protein [Myxococcus sp. CA040A]TQF14470.1 prepilin-type N-terminal cleavage/methylation domain-containing protein [Myxococcus llanfairpwllgwyngyllgogerychwyrndrobwllllantysiliogogogochensis]